MKVSQFFIFFCLICALAGGAPTGILIAVAGQSEGASSTSSELRSQIASRLQKVEEFRFIREEAKKLGVRAWLFGGTAAGYGHYVKWDLQREKGDSRFQPDRFDYDYTNIYRSTQDLDIVIDGDPDKARALQKALVAKYPHMQGSKSAWEVRLLRQDLHDKQALLNNPDFLNQHTDSNSTGMIELTPPPKGEPVVRDLRDWESAEPVFLKDLRDGMLHYYFSPLHETTKFYKEGRNPPILSAIRYLTKAFQYELKIRPEDLKELKRVIEDCNPKRDTSHPYVSDWIEKNGKKLFQNAVNLEYAWNTLEELGLRKKLISIKDDSKLKGSLAWWMEKEPLRTQEVGRGSGRTAEEIFKALGQRDSTELKVAHETRDFLAYESITRAHTGEPNVFASRRGTVGEGAAYGNGFYTRVGKEGAAGTGLTIRFRLNPKAREGEDFIYVPEEEYFVLRNKAAIEVIPESLNFTPVSFFEYLRGIDTLEHSDTGVLEKLRRRIGTKIQALSRSDQSQIIRIALEEAARPNPSELFMKEFLSQPFGSKTYPKILKAFLESDSDPSHTVLAEALKLPRSKANEEVRKTARRLADAMIKDGPHGYSKGQLSEVANFLDQNMGHLSKSRRAKVRERIADFMESVVSSEDLSRAFAFDYFSRHPRDQSKVYARLWEAFDKSVQADLSDKSIIQGKWLQSPSSIQSPEVLDQIMSKKHAPPPELIKSADWAKTPSYKKWAVPMLLNDPIALSHFYFLDSPAAHIHPELAKSISMRIIEELRDLGQSLNPYQFILRIHPSRMPKEMKNAMIERIKSDPDLAKKVLWVLPHEEGWKEARETQEILKWISETHGTGVEPDTLSSFLYHPELRSQVKDLDVLYLEMLRRKKPRTHPGGNDFYLLESEELAKTPRHMEVLKAFMKFDWDSRRLDKHYTETIIGMLKRPEYRDAPGAVDLIGKVIESIDRLAEYQQGDQIEHLKKLLSNEPFSKDRRATLWRYALSTNLGSRRSDWIKTQEYWGDACHKSFEELIEAHRAEGR